MSDPIALLSDQLEAEITDAFLEAIDDMGSIDIPSLIAAAERGDQDDVLAYVGDHLRSVREILDRGFARAGTLAAQRLGLSFDPAEPIALAARAAAVASVMRSLIADTAAAMLQAAFRSTLLPAAIAGSILVAAVPVQAAEKAILVCEAIGLSPAQGASLAVFRSALEAVHARQQPTPEPRPGFTREKAIVPELPAHVLRHLSAPQRSVIEKAGRLSLDRQQVADLVARQRRALLEIRAGAIGTAGAVTITNAGESASWQQAVTRRDLGPEWRRHWRDRGDERVRHIHREVKTLNPNGVGIDEPFATALGPCHAPPLEAGCRCRVELRRVAA